MTSWLGWSLLAVVALVLAWLAARRSGWLAPWRSRWLAARRKRRRAAPRTRPPVTARPRAGEIWWADVPYDDGTGSKVRPCLVLRTRRRHADVLKITSQDKQHRTDHVRLPTRSWDPRAERDSSLDVVNLIRLRSAAFVRRAGACDPKVWRAVRRFHGIGTQPRGSRTS